LAPRGEVIIDELPANPSFDEILGAYQDKVFRLCCAMLGNRGLAEETAQDVFVRVWKALPGYRGEASVSTWIYAIARNSCLTAIKKRGERPAESLEIPGVRREAERTLSAVPHPDRQPDLLRLVADLPEHYRQVVLLFYMEDKSYDEVAAMLDLPLGTVKTYLHRARLQLAEAATIMERGS
jgi:RNA polymerase sigma-70 factor (ECF subfamily)